MSSAPSTRGTSTGLNQAVCQPSPCGDHAGRHDLFAGLLEEEELFDDL